MNVPGPVGEKITRGWSCGNGDVRFERIGTLTAGLSLGRALDVKGVILSFEGCVEIKVRGNGKRNRCIPIVAIGVSVPPVEFPAQRGSGVEVNDVFINCAEGECGLTVDQTTSGSGDVYVKRIAGKVGLKGKVLRAVFGVIDLMDSSEQS